MEISRNIAYNLGALSIDNRKVRAKAEKLNEIFEEIVYGAEDEQTDSFSYKIDKTKTHIKNTFGLRHVFVKTSATPERTLRIMNAAIARINTVCELLVMHGDTTIFGLNGCISLHIGMDRNIEQGSTLAYYNLGEKKIVVRENVDDFSLQDATSTIAHEWMHAYDHYKGGVDMYSRGGMTMNGEWIDNFLDIINKSEYKKRIAIFGAGDPKWVRYASQPWELMAFAIQGYMQRKVKGKYDWNYPPVLDKEIIDYLDKNKISL